LEVLEKKEVGNTRRKKATDLSVFIRRENRKRTRSHRRNKSNRRNGPFCKTPMAHHDIVGLALPKDCYRDERESPKTPPPPLVLAFGTSEGGVLNREILSRNMSVLY